VLSEFSLKCGILQSSLIRVSFLTKSSFAPISARLKISSTDKLCNSGLDSIPLMISDSFNNLLLSLSISFSKSSIVGSFFFESLSPKDVSISLLILSYLYFIST